jgi:release factor glutamine methyltransferase
VSSRVEFLQGDLFGALGSRSGGPSRFDVIVSNPPYIASREIAQLQRDVSLHEPHLALDGGPEGLDIIRRLIAESPDHLVPAGWLLFEIGNDQGESTRRLLEADGRYTSIAIQPDSAGLPRVACGRSA